MYVQVIFRQDLLVFIWFLSSFRFQVTFCNRPHSLSYLSNSIYIYKITCFTIYLLEVMFLPLSFLSAIFQDGCQILWTLNPYSAGINLRLQILMSKVHPNTLYVKHHIKTDPALKGLIHYKYHRL